MRVRCKGKPIGGRGGLAKRSGGNGDWLFNHATMACCWSYFFHESILPFGIMPFLTITKQWIDYG
jgi:hypothetical protein